MVYISEAVLVKAENPTTCELCSTKNKNYISVDGRFGDMFFEFCLCGKCSVLFQWVEAEYLEKLEESNLDFEGVLIELSEEGVTPPVPYPFPSSHKPSYKDLSND